MARAYHILRTLQSERETRLIRVSDFSCFVYSYFSYRCQTYARKSDGGLGLGLNWVWLVVVWVGGLAGWFMVGGCDGWLVGGDIHLFIDSYDLALVHSLRPFRLLSLFSEKQFMSY